MSVLEPMTDAELTVFLGFKDTDDQDAVKRHIASITPEQRELYEAMRQIEAWDATDGLIPLPDCIMVDKPRKRR